MPPRDRPLSPGDPGHAELAEELAITEWVEAGAPSPMQMWAELHGKPPVADSTPLTVAGAAAREGVAEKTIRRRLPQLEAMDPTGAYKIGSAWRIVPAALDALREGGPQQPKGTKARSRRASAPTRKSSTRWEV